MQSRAVVLSYFCSAEVVQIYSALDICVKAMGVEEVKTAPQSPWQNPFAEGLIGSIRRECLDHVIVFNERSLKRVLRSYVDYYHHSRTHLSLGKDAPATRQVQSPEIGILWMAIAVLVLIFLLRWCG